MRLTANERQIIVQKVLLQDPEALVFLYGSRVDDSARGGDIDLLVLSERLTFSDRLEILSALKEALGDQKIDLLVRKESATMDDAFVRSIFSSAVPLNSRIG